MSADTVTITLNKPIPAHGETLSALVLRRPTVRELRQCGAPYHIVAGGGSGGVVPDYDACAKLIAAVCAIPSSSVDLMDGADFDEAALVLLGFTKRAPVAASASGSAPTA